MPTLSVSAFRGKADISRRLVPPLKRLEFSFPSKVLGCENGNPVGQVPEPHSYFRSTALPRWRTALELIAASSRDAT